jgi:hypothetical protein
MRPATWTVIPHYPENSHHLTLNRIYCKHTRIARFLKTRHYTVVEELIRPHV